MALLTSGQAEPRFQDARDVTRASVMATVSPGLISLLPLLLRVSGVKVKNAELWQLQDELSNAWRLGAIEVKCPGDPYHQGW
jgi:hypothetical protein